MMFDSVREELQTKITSGRLTPRDARAEPPGDRIQAMPGAVIGSQTAGISPRPVMAGSRTAAAVAVAPQRDRSAKTADLVSPKTSPTLVGFQNTNTSVPDWRLQLQNAVQMRKGGRVDAIPATESADVRYPSNGSLALKAQIVQRTQPVEDEPEISDPRVASALRRINESRNTFLEPERKMPVRPAAAPLKSYKFDIVPTKAAPISSPARTTAVPKPRLVSSAPLMHDANSFPAIDVRPEIAESPTEFTVAREIQRETPAEFAEINRIRITADHDKFDEIHTREAETDDIEDLAHFSMRFGAGLFDLIIAAFASLFVLSPIAFTRGGWLTAAGLLTFGGVCAVVTFLYMTISLGFYGKTMGMRLFSLELVDAVENEYPTLHQAAVSSAVYILSLVFGGAGFLTIFFNEENRAAHDLLSGTILVREF